MSFKQFYGAVSTDWSDPANWVGGALPGPGDDVVLYANAAIAPGSYSYGSIVGYLGATLTLSPTTVVTVNETYLLGSNLSGGTLATNVLNAIAGDIEGTTLSNTALASGFTSANIGLSGRVSVDQQLNLGTNILAVTNQLTLAGATELQFGEIDLDNGNLVFTGTGAAATLTVDAAAILRAAAGGAPAGTASVGAGTVINNGLLAVDPGETLRMAGTLVNNGTVSVAAGATLELDGPETQAQLGTVTGPGQVVYGGTVDNTGRTLTTLGTRNVHGGTLLTGGQVFHPGNPGLPTTLDGVSVQGLLDLAGSAALLKGGTSFTAGFGGASGAIKLESGTLALDGYTVLDNMSVELAGGALSATAPTHLGRDAALIVSGNATLGANVVVDGIATIGAGGTLTLAGVSLARTATVYIENGGTLVAPVSEPGTTRFAGAGTVEFTGTGALSATLSQFHAGDSVQFDGMSGGAASLSGNVLTVTDGTTTATLTLVDGGAYAQRDFTLAANGRGQTVLTTGHIGTAVSDPLFDQAYYLSHNPQVGASGLDPYRQYLQTGAFNGLNPSAWFDSAFYLKQNPDVAAAGFNPLVHYEGFGWKEGRAPSLVFSDPAYQAQYPDVAGTDPLASFVTSGQAAGRTAALSPAGAAGDPLVNAAYLFGQLGATLLPAPGAAADAEAASIYKSGGWTKGENPDAYFDTKFYMANYGQEVRASGLDPLTHYETIGWTEGHDPSLLFSTNAYLSANPDVAAARMDPLMHYVVFGHTEGRVMAAAPAGAAVDPLIDVATVAGHVATLLPAGGADPAAVSAFYHGGGWRFISDPNPLFDSRYYLAANPDVAAAGIDPLAHYEANGAAEGRSPSPAFDDRFYLASNPDVAASGINPLLHYETSGWHEGRDPNPLFNTNYYLASNPDIRAAGVDPFVQYEQSGRHEGRNPSPLLDVKYYLSHNPDVTAANIDPMSHFESSGWHEGRNPDAFFDVNYYLSHNPDVAAAGIDPLIHYDEFGWKEGRNPSASFNTNAYLAHNPDVRAAGVDPLVHYLASGMAEGRAIYAAT